MTREHSRTSGNRAAALLRTAVVVALALTSDRAAAQRGSDSSLRPRLVVVVAIPGLRADYLQRMTPHLGPTGVRRMLRRGARYSRVRTGLVFPEIAAATATLATGAWPRQHGVVGPRWWNRQTQRAEGPPEVLAITPTLTDRLEAATSGASHTLTIAWSESAARLAGGASVDTCCWFDADKLAFRARVAAPGAAAPAWLAPFRSARKLRRWRGKEWVRFLPAWRYAECAEDDRIGERGEDLGSCFPHRMPRDDAALARAIARTPFGDRLLFEVTVNALLNGAIGRDEIPDLVVVIPEALAGIGRRFGPASHEVADAVARLDMQLGLFLSFLDVRVGAGRWSAFLVGLHGMPPLATEAVGRGQVMHTLARSVASLPNAPDSASVGSDPVVPQALGFAEEQEPMIWIGARLFSRPPSWPGGDDPETVLRSVRARLAWAPAVHAVLTPSHFSEDRLPTGRLGRVLSRAHYAQRAGDLLVVLGPNARWEGDGAPAGPWNHTDEVAMIAMGTGVRRGRFDEPVTLASVAPMAARLLGLAQFRAEPDAGRADVALRDRARNDAR